MSSNIGGAGLGCTEVVEKPQTSEKTNIWKMTQVRFHKLPECNKDFEDISD